MYDIAARNSCGFYDRSDEKVRKKDVVAIWWFDADFSIKHDVHRICSWAAYRKYRT